MKTISANPTRDFPSRFQLSAFLLLLLLAAPAARAGTITFGGGTSGNNTALDTNTNWVGDVLPVTTDEVLLDDSATTLRTTLTTTGRSPTYGDLIWNNNATSTITINTSTVTSRAITLSGGGNSTAAIAAGGAAGDLLVMGADAIANTLTIGGNSGNGTARLVLALAANGNFDVVNSGATLAISGVLSGNFSLAKTGAGTLIFSGNNTYSGATTISAGTLVLSNTGTIAGSSGVNLGTSGSPGTLNLTGKTDSFSFGAGQSVSGCGAINIGANNTVTVNGNLSPGNSMGVVAVTGNLALSGTANTTMELMDFHAGAGTGFDAITVSGALAYGGTLSISATESTTLGGYNLFGGFTSGSGSFLINFLNPGTDGTFDYGTGVLTLTAVPETGTWVLVGIGLTFLLYRKRLARILRNRDKDK